MTNNGFFVFSGLMESLKSLKTNSKKWKTFEAIFNYAVSGVCPDNDIESSGIFLLCKAMIDGKSAKLNKESDGESSHVENNQGCESKSARGNKRVSKSIKKPAKISKIATISKKTQEKSETESVDAVCGNIKTSCGGVGGNEKILGGTNIEDNSKLVKVGKDAEIECKTDLNNKSILNQNKTKMKKNESILNQNKTKMKKNESILNQNGLKMSSNCNLVVEYVESLKPVENKEVAVGEDECGNCKKNKNFYYNKKNNKNKIINILSSSYGENIESETCGSSRCEEDNKRVVARGVRSLKNRVNFSKKVTILPKLEEVEAFVNNSGLKVNPNAFYCYYLAKNWEINGTPILDWRAVLLKWNDKIEFNKSNWDNGLVYEHHSYKESDHNKIYSSLDDSLF